MPAKHSCVELVILVELVDFFWISSNVLKWFEMAGLVDYIRLDWLVEMVKLVGLFSLDGLVEMVELFETIDLVELIDLAEITKIGELGELFALIKLVRWLKLLNSFMPRSQLFLIWE